MWCTSLERLVHIGEWFILLLVTSPSVQKWDCLPAAISCLHRDEAGDHEKINMEWDEVAKQMGTRGRIACMKKWSYMQARNSMFFFCEAQHFQSIVGVITDVYRVHGLFQRAFCCW